MGNAGYRSQRSGFVRKETGWTTNRPGLAELLKGERSNREAKAERSTGTSTLSAGSHDRRRCIRRSLCARR